MISRRLPFTDLRKVAPILLAIWLAGAGRAAEGQPLILIEPDTPKLRTVIGNEIAWARSQFRAEFGLDLTSRFAVVGAPSSAVINDQLAQAWASLKRPGRIRVNIASFCARRGIGAFAARGFIGLCWGPQVNVDALAASDFRPHITHELIHLLQYQLAGDDPVRWLPDRSDRLLGPAWLVEGSAEWFEARARGIPDQLTERDLFNLQSRARRARIKLDALNKTGTMQSGAAYGTARFAAALLAQRHGSAALFDYFTELGRLGRRDAAFQAVFGQSLPAFEKEFEGLRRDFGAARDWVRAGNGN